MIFRYRGGIRPQNRKERTQRKPLAELDTMPHTVTLFLQQSTGAEAKPVVRVGQGVRAGECIAAAQGEDGVPVHASLSGRVTALEDCADAQGKFHPAIVIEVGKQQGTVPPVDIDWENVTPDDLIHLCRHFGLVEQVGDPVALHVKILDARGKVDTLVVNMTECQPYLTAAYRMGLERGRDLIVGARLLARILGVQSTIFAATGDQVSAVERLERDLRRGGQGDAVGRSTEVKTIPTRYPLYDDKQIVLAATGREVPPEQTAVAVGCQVFSVVAVCALGRAFTTGLPVTHTPITVSGLAVSRPRNLWVPLGSSLHNLLENCNGVEEEPVLTLTGGLMTGLRVTKLHAPVEKNTQGLLCLGEDELPRQRVQQTCLQCGTCIKVCPMGLCPVFIFRAVQRGAHEKLVGLHPQDCIGCGACASVCPSQISLMLAVKSAAELLPEKEDTI